MPLYRLPSLLGMAEDESRILGGRDWKYSFGAQAPQDVVPTSSYSTTSGQYGAFFSAKFGPSSPPLVLRRPKGADIGTSRPWPSMNKELLAPRVPQSWLLEKRPATSAMLARASTPGFPQFSSHRDVSGAASLLFSSEAGAVFAPKAPHAHDAWFKLNVMADAHGQWSGTGRPSRHGSSAQATAQRIAGNTALGLQGFWTTLGAVSPSPRQGDGGGGDAD